MLTNRTPEAHASALKTFREYKYAGMFQPPSADGSIVFPGYDGGGEWGGPAFDPETGLLYVNANEMAWLLRMMPRDDRSLYKSNCASCHGDDMKGGAMAPSLLDIAQRATRARSSATIIRQGTGRMPAFAEMLEGGAINDLVNFLVTGKDVAETAATNPNFLKYRNNGYPIFLDHDGYPGDLAAVGHAERDRPEHGRDSLEDPVRRVSGACGAGDQEHGHGQLRRPGRDGERSAVHRRDDVRQEVPRVRQADGRAAVGGGASRVRQRDAVALRRERQGVRRDRCGGRKERRAVGRDVRGVQSAVGGKREAGSGRRRRETGEPRRSAPLTDSRLPLPGISASRQVRSS